MNREFYVYILSSYRNTVLYIGKTDDLNKRVMAHKANLIPGFTSKYKIHKLVYYEKHNSEHEAFRRERSLKEWHRQWKINLIENLNPEWRDLSKTPAYAGAQTKGM